MYELIEFATKNIKDQEFKENLLVFINNISVNDIEDYATKYNLNTLKFNNDSLENYIYDKFNLMQNDDRFKRFLTFYTSFNRSTSETSLLEPLNIVMAILIYFFKKDKYKYENNELNIQFENIIYYFENKIEEENFQEGFVIFLENSFEKKIYDESDLAKIFEEIEQKKEKIILNDRIKQLSIFYGNILVIYEDETLRKINDLMFFYIKNIEIDKTELIDMEKFNLVDLKKFFKANISDNDFFNVFFLFIELFLNSKNYDEDFKRDCLLIINKKKINIMKSVLIKSIAKHFDSARDYLSSIIYSDYLLPLTLTIIKDHTNND